MNFILEYILRGQKEQNYLFSRMEIVSGQSYVFQLRWELSSFDVKSSYIRLCWFFRQLGRADSELVWKSAAPEIHCKHNYIQAWACYFEPVHEALSFEIPYLLSKQ